MTENALSDYNDSIIRIRSLVWALQMMFEDIPDAFLFSNEYGKLMLSPRFCEWMVERGLAEVERGMDGQEYMRIPVQVMNRYSIYGFTN